MYSLEGGLPDIRGRGRSRGGSDDEDGEWVWMRRDVQSCWYWRLYWMLRAREKRCGGCVVGAG
jgi:hypothetical protein